LKKNKTLFFSCYLQGKLGKKINTKNNYIAFFKTDFLIE